MSPPGLLLLTNRDMLSLVVPVVATAAAPLSLSRALATAAALSVASAVAIPVVVVAVAVAERTSMVASTTLVVVSCSGSLAAAVVVVMVAPVGRTVRLVAVGTESSIASRAHVALLLIWRRATIRVRVRVRGRCGRHLLVVSLLRLVLVRRRHVELGETGDTYKGATHGSQSRCGSSKTDIDHLPLIKVTYSLGLHVCTRQK